MILVCSNNQDLLAKTSFASIEAEEAIAEIMSWGVVQYDCETKKRNPHIGTLLSAQFGNETANKQIVVDCLTVDIRLFKCVFDSKLIIGHNLKFDIQWLYNFGIVPAKVYDTMVMEQFIYLGYPTKRDNDLSAKEKAHAMEFSLAALCDRYLGIELDKTVRGQINWRGLDDTVIEYAGNDVVYLETLMRKQVNTMKARNQMIGAKIECDFVRVVAYLEWCGIKLDEDKWKAKMANDQKNLSETLIALNTYCKNHPKLQKWVKVDLQGDLWTGFDEEPKWTIDWQKEEAIDVFRTLGFNLWTKDKRTGKPKESTEEKVLKPQKGIDDEFLKLYFAYMEYYKVTTTYGQGHLNLINPNTGRLHTNYWQIGTASGRMSSGSGKDEDIAQLKHLLPEKVPMVNMQQLPHDTVTRSCFVAEPGNLFCSCDYSAMEARIGAEVYNEKMLLDEFLYGSGDTHAAYAKVVFADELKDVDVKDVKTKRPDLRNRVKSIEFAVQFGSDGSAVAPQLGITVKEAQALVSNLLDGMKGLAAYKKTGAAFVRNYGYVYAMPQTGHKSYIANWKEWHETQKTFTPEFWERYKPVKAKKDKALAEGLDKFTYMNPEERSMAMLVSSQWRIASKWDRLALNIPTQGGGAVVLKTAANEWFKWVIEHGYFGKILLVNLTHDRPFNLSCINLVNCWKILKTKVHYVKIFCIFAHDNSNNFKMCNNGQSAALSFYGKSIRSTH